MAADNFMVYLARHGETDSNVTGGFDGGIFPGGSLSSRGKNQAHMLGIRLQRQEIKFYRAISSDQARSRETADKILSCRYLAFYYAIDLILDSAFRERSDGEWAGKKKDDIDPDLLAAWRAGDASPGGESLKDVNRRVNVAFTRYVQENYAKDRSILIISSGNPLRAIIGEILGMPISGWAKLTQDNTGLTLIRFIDPATPLIEFSNDRSHLYGIGFTPVIK